MNYFEQLLEKEQQKEIDKLYFSEATNSSNALFCDMYTVTSQVLGKGGFGELRLTCYKNDRNRKLVTKVIAKENLLKWQRRGDVLLEAEILLKLNHKNIVTGVDVFSNSDYYHVILELAPGDSLFDIIEDQLRLMEDSARIIFIQVKD